MKYYQKTDLIIMDDTQTIADTAAILIATATTAKKNTPARYAISS